MENQKVEIEKSITERAHELAMLYLNNCDLSNNTPMEIANTYSGAYQVMVDRLR